MSKAWVDKNILIQTNKCICLWVYQVQILSHSINFSIQNQKFSPNICSVACLYNFQVTQNFLKQMIYDLSQVFIPSTISLSITCATFHDQYCWGPNHFQWQYDHSLSTRYKQQPLARERYPSSSQHWTIFHFYIFVLKITRTGIVSAPNIFVK